MTHAQTSKVRIHTRDNKWGERHATPTGTTTTDVHGTILTEYIADVIITERRKAPSGLAEMVLYTYPGPVPKDQSRHGFAHAKRVVA